MTILLFKRPPAGATKLELEKEGALWLTDTACTVNTTNALILHFQQQGAKEVVTLDLRHPDGGVWGLSDELEKSIREQIAENFRDSEEAMEDRRE